MQTHVEVQVEGETIGALPTPFIVGRDPECDVILPDSSVSRRHLRVTASDDGLFVEDMGSSNGTWLDGRRIAREIIPSGHPFIVGRVSVALRFSDGKAAKPFKPERKKRQAEASRHQTLAVDVPQDFFDPAPAAPAMRLFDCPGCGRRLRCQAHTSRVKCRSCSSIIRFDGETPLLERPGPDVSTPRQKARSSQRIETVQKRPKPEPAPEPERRPSPAPAPEPQRRTAAHPVDRDDFRLEEPIIQPGLVRGSMYLIAGGGVIAVLGSLGTLFDMFEGKMTPIVVTGAILALIGFLMATAQWMRGQAAGGAPAASYRSVDDRLAHLAHLRDAGLISEEDCDRRKQEILRDI